MPLAATPGPNPQPAQPSATATAATAIRTRRGTSEPLLGDEDRRGSRADLAQFGPDQRQLAGLARGHGGGSLDVGRALDAAEADARDRRRRRRRAAVVEGLDLERLADGRLRRCREHDRILLATRRDAGEQQLIAALDLEVADAGVCHVVVIEQLPVAAAIVDALAEDRVDLDAEAEVLAGPVAAGGGVERAGGCAGLRATALGRDAPRDRAPGR